MTNNQQNHSHTTPQRVIPLTGTVNFRDLGGYQTTSGQTVAWQKIYRAASLGGLTSDDCVLLSDLNIDWDIDLRAPSEQSAYPDQAWPNVQVVLNPVYPTTNFDRIINYHGIQRLLKGSHRQPKLTDPVAQIYQNVILNPHSQAAFAKTFTVLLGQATDAATVFHCAAGKDRTGMTAALILMALGVPTDTIIQDYLLTNDLYDFPDGQTALNNDAVQAAVAKMNTKTGEALYIQGALQTVAIGYGGIANYWQEALHLSPTDLDTFRQKFLN
ncbi:tyrosine-protein phosphatase [Lapidilactobacillus wuchangensis]|uniref:tyrosine-protein phosphatase n=1 Tax=Lapidilactobacillus wuchangensis TaxID=2486001 RepID=UPI000F793DF4|nr:tyrosine-protein phosphatase [Lapidilactobacillus wuchangensis]